MDNHHYTNYNIDAADIWEYECSYSEGKRDKNRMYELYEFLRQFYLGAKHKPIIDATAESEKFTEYRERFINNRDDEVCWPFFLWDAKVYSMIRPCVVRLKAHNHLAFQSLFNLKLNQYGSGLLYIEAFLKHQLKSNFKNNLTSFRKFLNVSLLQYPTAIDCSIIKIIDEWFIESEKKKSEKAAKPKSKRSKRKNFDEQIIKADTEVTNPNLDDDSTKQTDDTNSNLVQNQDKEVSGDKNKNQEDVNVENKLEESERGKQEVEKLSAGKEEHHSTEPLPVELETEETIPNSYKIVEGKFTKGEVQQFFSFLYKEKSREGKTFLLENEVIEIFKYGLAIPPEPLAKKYKLNCSLKFPKGIVEYCIYTFYKEHTSNHQKQDILKFFAIYIEDFAKALKSDSAMQTWCDNVVGKRPARTKFAIGEYLPERFR